MTEVGFYSAENSFGKSLHGARTMAVFRQHAPMKEARESKQSLSLTVTVPAERCAIIENIIHSRRAGF